MAKSNENEIRTRNYSTIVYKDSAPENWLDILSDELVQCFISPYHDKDVNPDGEIKKPHWHVLIMFDSVKSERQAQFIVDKIKGVGCKRVNSLRSYARYLCHLDNPDKYQYPISDVIQLYGADYLEVISLDSDKYPIIEEIIHFIEANNVTSFYLLCKYAFNYNESWKRLLCSGNTIFFKEYLKSKVWSNEKDLQHIYDIHGREII